jgi:hypothetical protein
VGQVEARRLDQLALRADALENQDELQLVEHDRVDARPSPLGIVFPRPVANKAQIQLRLKVAAKAISRDQILERNGDRLVEAAGFGRVEHSGLRGNVRTAPVDHPCVSPCRGGTEREDETDSDPFD